MLHYIILSFSAPVSDQNPEVVISEDGAEHASSLLPLLEESSVLPSPLPPHLGKRVYEADLEASRRRQQAEKERLRAEENGGRPRGMAAG